MSEDDYPYEAINDTCKFDATKIVTNISGYVHVKAADEEALRVAVGTVGPISVAVDAHGLQLYKEGIYNDDVHCGNSTWDLNHGILVVGYGEEKARSTGK
ncbi:hypothetical protein NQ317_007470 [Molorchus minor]|uniref:Peptidase C1A papain C-terminal domain-containing protein n=1 Tax=Molorchus minor TaxID=1323400 RepID=A0ABQ9K1I4_9CUCU|nr:hypothetical protein NQ317_007470 [Molorchus minor]